MTDLEFQDTVTADAKLTEWRNRVDLPRMRALIHEHKREMGREGEWLRIFAICEQNKEINDELFEASLTYARRKEDIFSGTMIALRVERLLKTRDKLNSERECLIQKGQSGHSKRAVITDAMIERAKEYPVENLVDVKRGMAKCIAHEDRTPSMDCRNGFVYCHGCGFHADVIGVYQKLHGVTFPEAVRALQ